jgi:hypothetical protein
MIDDRDERINLILGIICAPLEAVVTVDGGDQAGHQYW